MKKELNQVKCPNCGHPIDVNDILYHQLKEESNQEFKEKLNSEKTKLEKRLREQFQSETSEQIKILQSELQLKSSQVKDLNKTKSEIEKLKREKDELREQISFEKEKEFSDKLKQEKLKLRKQVDEENAMKIKELEKQLEDQKELAIEMKRKAEQGSMQLQGEVMELELEKMISAIYPMDEVKEVGKGSNGVDILVTVRNMNQQECGLIAIESKRTKAFSNGWIDKLKTDQRHHKADIAILVTEVMPKDMPKFGWRNGVWVCTPQELASLIFILRESFMKIQEIKSAEENKSDKVSLLYAYLTSQEFAGQIQVLVETFSGLKSNLEHEKKSMLKIWKERERQIEYAVQSTAEIFGSIKGIAGSAIKRIKSLELPSLTEKQ